MTGRPRPGRRLLPLTVLLLGGLLPLVFEQYKLSILPHACFTPGIMQQD